MPVQFPNKDVSVSCVCMCVYVQVHYVCVLACVLSVCESMSQLGVCQADRSSWVVIFDCWAVEALWASLFVWCGTGLCFDLHSSGCHHSANITKRDAERQSLSERDRENTSAPDVSLAQPLRDMSSLCVNGYHVWETWRHYQPVTHHLPCLGDHCWEQRPEQWYLSDVKWTLAMDILFQSHRHI